ncbi:Abhydrolase domain-containing protein mpaH [Mycena sanguinolenta]|uniref:Abhydrolase domain-containing protein mpaH n=1 Tax=Mycena sanguinolenta TaxID=230812 RepID=A0A8H7D0D5_9AGAR|nr:Abhydrolase domain-containing protein mpaH [Mycena sanguinolenta]
MPALASQLYTFDPRPRYPLRLSAARYWDPSSETHDDPTAPTLVFTHATGAHKEQYEPTIQDLYNYNLAGPKTKIREVWTIDAPDHGDSAVLNEEALRDGGRAYHPVFGWDEYARGLHAFLAGLGTGVDVDFSKRRLVLIGHSSGAVVVGMCLIRQSTASSLALTYQPELKPEFLIMIEIMGMNTEVCAKMREILTKGSANRRDIWPSRAEAYRLFTARAAYREWDDRVLRIFVEKGLRPLPTLEYPDKDKEGVTLKCTRKQETATYRDNLASPAVYTLMRFIVQRFQTHFIDGTVDNYLSRAVKDDFLENAVGGMQNLASFSHVSGAGHLVAQTHPTGLAKALLDVLTKEERGRKMHTKL